MPGRLLLRLLGALMLVGASAGAQDAQPCEAVQADDPPRTVFSCPGGLTVEAEAAAALGFEISAPPDAPRRADLDGAAALIEVEPGQGGFEIRTPHAIASVRGTVFAVDVADDETAVFVAEGQVSVRRSGDAGEGAEVVLSDGQGTTVGPDTPLTVRKWGADRVAALLARFGR